MCTPADVAAPEVISALDALDRAHSLGALSDDLHASARLRLLSECDEAPAPPALAEAPPPTAPDTQPPPAFAEAPPPPAPAEELVERGCPKCRWSRKGCKACRGNLVSAALPRPTSSRRSQPRPRKKAPAALADAITCGVCGSGDDDESILLCDGCDRAYHMRCLDPPVVAVPDGDWFCAGCTSAPAEVIELSTSTELVVHDGGSGNGDGMDEPEVEVVEVHGGGGDGGGDRAAQSAAEREASAAKLAALRTFVAESGGAVAALDGWTARTETRRGGTSSSSTESTSARPAGHRQMDTYFFSPPPDARRFRSRVEVARFLGLEVSTSRKRAASEAPPAAAAVAPAPKRKKPAAKPKPAPAPSPKPAPAPAAEAATLWPAGGTWVPNTNEWGTRAAGAYGCGKCRWNPLKGCRGCRAAADTYVSPPPLALTPGTVSLPHGPNLPRKGEERLSDERRAEIRRDLAKVLGPVVQVVGGAAQSDHAGHGVVAARPIRRGETIADPSSIFINRPADYARAHLGLYAYVAYGSHGYFRFYEPAYGHRSLGFFVNQAGHVADGEAPDPTARPNVKYASARPRDGGLVFALQALEDIPAGAELLANYEDNERVSGTRAWE